VAGLGELCAERAALATGAKLAGLGEGDGGGRDAGKCQNLASLMKLRILFWMS
jgi:hypothetical protein